MARQKVIQGTLELLILRTLDLGPLHGHGIAKHIQRTSQEVLQIDHGSLYPALHRLVKNGCILARWEPTERGRDMRIYRIEAKGRRQLKADETRWAELVRAMSRAGRPA